jgi:hypothetical protein
MNKLLGLVAGAIASFGLISSPVQAAGLPLVISATAIACALHARPRIKLLDKQEFGLAVLEATTLRR